MNFQLAHIIHQHLEGKLTLLIIIINSFIKLNLIKLLIFYNIITSILLEMKSAAAPNN
jgi:hypothetical protein